MWISTRLYQRLRNALDSLALEDGSARSLHSLRGLRLPGSRPFDLRDLPFDRATRVSPFHPPGNCTAPHPPQPIPSVASFHGSLHSPFHFEGFALAPLPQSSLALTGAHESAPGARRIEITSCQHPFRRPSRPRRLLALPQRSRRRERPGPPASSPRPGRRRRCARPEGRSHRHRSSRAYR